MNEDLGIILVITPPVVSIPRLKGVASITTNYSDDSSPQITPP